MANKIPDDVLRDARAEAVRQLVNRERRDGLEAMRLALSRASTWRDKLLDRSQRGRFVVDKDGNVIPGGCIDAERTELFEELKRVELQVRPYYHNDYGGTDLASVKECAPDSEGFDEALRRVLLERGVSAHQVAKLLGAVDVANGKERKAADRAKRALVAEHKADVSFISALDKLRGVTPFSTALRAELEAKIDKLSVDRKSKPKKPKSSSRKRR